MVGGAVTVLGRNIRKETEAKTRERKNMNEMRKRCQVNILTGLEAYHCRRRKDVPAYLNSHIWCCDEC
jgi:hypothetical protein